MTEHILWIAILAVVPAAPATADEGEAAPSDPPGEPTSRPAAEAEALEAAIAEIEAATDPQEAWEAWTHGCAIDRDHPPLHEAQMRRMLAFGLPRYARGPAWALTRTDGTYPLAWALLGYIAGKNGRLHDAASYTIRAGLDAPENEGVLHNLGLIVAWYDLEEDARRRIPTVLREKLTDQRGDWNDHEAYRKARESVEEDYVALERIRVKWEKSIAEAEDELDPLRREVAAYQRRLRSLENDVRSHIRQKDRYEEELAGVQREIDERRRRGENDDSQQRRAHELGKLIEREKEKIRELNREGEKVHDEGKGVFRQAAKLEDELKDMRRKLRAELAQNQPDFDFVPPAVDGRIVPEREDVRLDVSDPFVAPEEPEEKLATRMEMAELYLKNNMPGKAAEILRKVVLHHEGTEEAERAQELLRRLGEE